MEDVDQEGQTYTPHWEMHGRTLKQHLIVAASDYMGRAACGILVVRGDLTTGNYKRGENRCRTCNNGLGLEERGA